MLEPRGQRQSCKTLQIVELMNVPKRPTREQNTRAHCLKPNFQILYPCRNVDQHNGICDTHFMWNACSAILNDWKGKWDNFLAYREILPFSNKKPSWKWTGFHLPPSHWLQTAESHEYHLNKGWRVRSHTNKFAQTDSHKREHQWGVFVFKHRVWTVIRRGRGRNLMAGQAGISENTPRHKRAKGG